MATAPIPGKAQRDADASRLFRLTIGGETLEFMPSAVTLDERIQIRKQVGLPLETFVAGEDRIGEDSIAVLWWLAHRQSGHPNLSWKQFGFTWAGFNPDTDEVEVTEDDGEPTDSPEGSGPGSETPSLASPSTSGSAPGRSNA